MLKYIAEQILNKNDIALPHTDTSANGTTIQHALNVFYVLIGAIAFLILLIAALRYTLAGDNSEMVGQSKRMIIYTFIGLLVIGLASTIVEFILKVQT
ncbi:MAG TPA: pilin [Candidatus Saccharimonadales bacterium]|nr:pilin [Candidatus Saccharimonadales bacterium]